jgi:hypothetical protein
MTVGALAAAGAAGCATASAANKSDAAATAMVERRSEKVLMFISPFGYV